MGAPLALPLSQEPSPCQLRELGVQSLGTEDGDSKGW